MAVKQKTHDYVERTSIGCRDALFDTLDGLRAGTMTPTLANATAKVIGEIINTVQLELNVAKFVQRGNKTTPKLGALTLGEK
jgi:hypothetical protein